MLNMFRSRDGGKTWQELVRTPFERKTVLSISVHPNNSQMLYAATITGLYFSQDGGDNWNEVESLSLATRQITGEDDDEWMVAYGYFVISDVIFDPFDSHVVYAATRNGGVWRSSDDGKTWTHSAGGMDPNDSIVKLLPDPKHPNVLYAASRLSGVFVTQDGGGSWQALNEGLVARNITNLALSTDGSILFAGSDGSGVYRL
jgi:photosystem II stability/assembly factor-like uncharacterized protein